MLQIKYTDKIETRGLYSTIYFSPQNSCSSKDNQEIYYTTGQATVDNMAYAHCMLDT